MKNWVWSASAVRVLDPGNEVRSGAPPLGLAKYIYYTITGHNHQIKMLINQQSKGVAIQTSSVPFFVLLRDVETNSFIEIARVRFLFASVEVSESEW